MALETVPLAQFLNDLLVSDVADDHAAGALGAVVVGVQSLQRPRCLDLLPRPMGVG